MEYFKKHIVFPDTRFYPNNSSKVDNSEDLGFRASYFYMHKKLCTDMGYDICTFSPELLSQVLSRGITIAYLGDNVLEKDRELLVISDFQEGRIQGYVVYIEDLEGLQDSLDRFPNAYHLEHSQEQYIRLKYPEVMEIISKARRK